MPEMPELSEKAAKKAKPTAAKKEKVNNVLSSDEIAQITNLLEQIGKVGKSFVASAKDAEQTGYVNAYLNAATAAQRFEALRQEVLDLLPGGDDDS